MAILSYTSLRQNLAEALERVEQGETIEITRRGHQSVLITPKTGNILESTIIKFASKEKFNASLKRIQKKHARNIKALADR